MFTSDGRIHVSLVCRVLMYVSETWPSRVEDEDHYIRIASGMIKWKCGINLGKNENRETKRMTLYWRGSKLSKQRKIEMIWSHWKENRNWLDHGACQSLLKDVKKGYGRDSKTWKQCGKSDPQQMNINRENRLTETEWNWDISCRKMSASVWKKRC